MARRRPAYPMVSATPEAGAYGTFTAAAAPPPSPWHPAPRLSPDRRALSRACPRARAPAAAL